MKRILILGCSGMLGYGVLRSLKKYDFKISATVRSKKKIKFLKNKINKSNSKITYINFDASKISLKDLSKLIKKYDYVINCIGIIKPEIDEKNNESISKAFEVNSYFPRKLSKASIKGKTKIFQIATDCVYSGIKGRYTESSLHDQYDIYGMSKSLGEIDNNKNFFNLRTSIIGKELSTKKSLFEWFNLQKNGSEINGYINHYWNGITTVVFGELVTSIILNNIKIPNFIHLTPRDRVSKYDLVLNFNKYFKKKLVIKKFKTKFSNDRTLKTIYPKIVNEIWRKSIFKKTLKIKEMVELV